MSHIPIKVSVISYPDRKSLVLRYTDPMSGRQVTRSARTTIRREAEKLAAKWEVEIQAGHNHPTLKISWEGFRERYEREVLPGLADKTGLMVGTVFKALEAILRPKRLTDLNAERLSYFQAKLRETRAEATIRTYLAHLASALKWAVDINLLPSAPKIQKPKRAKKSKLMKGRPITAEEFERMLEKVQGVVGCEAAPSWQFLLKGLWFSGLRLGESLSFYWDRNDKLCVDFSLKHPMLRIPAALEKGNEDRLLPMAPEFADFLAVVPPADRKGRVFKLQGLRVAGAALNLDWVSRVVAKVGKEAAIKVGTSAKTGRVKFASAHDLRRSFGERWARRVMPQVLKELMRHESIETTMKFYVGRNAQATADVLWAAHRQQIDSVASQSVRD